MPKLKNLVGADQLDKPLINQLLAEARHMEAAVRDRRQLDDLAGKIVACVFFEPSTRTRLSFESAVLRLGGQIVSMENAMGNSSSSKGESLTDTIRIINGYADAIVMRHPKNGAAAEAAAVSAVPLINAGDGGNEHPTQALLDLYTIFKRLHRLENLRVAFGFDPLHSRTIKSLAKLLALYPGQELIFVSPPALALPEPLAAELRAAGAKVSQTQNLAEALKADVFYANRLQQERFADAMEFEQNRKKFVITASLVAGKEVLLMDPLPKIDEIELAVDDLPNAIYFEQAKNGLYVRMAILKHLLGFSS